MRGDFADEARRFEDLDKAALTDCLLALHTCPTCRADLQPVAYTENVWGCQPCKETFHIPPKRDTE